MRFKIISTEDPNLNVGRILVRMSRGGQSVPAIRDSHQEAMKNLPNTRRHADDLLVYDNAPNGREQAGAESVLRLL